MARVGTIDEHCKVQSMIYISMDPLLGRSVSVKPRSGQQLCRTPWQRTLISRAPWASTQGRGPREPVSRQVRDRFRGRYRCCQRAHPGGAPADEQSAGALLPIMTLFRKKDHEQLDEVATQPSVYDDPSIAQFFTPTARYENLHRFDPGARWAWREDLVSTDLGHG